MAAIGTRLMLIQIGTPPVEYSMEVSTVEVDSADAKSDFVSFADAAAGGGRDYTLKFTAVQDAATASLWDTIWTQAGQEVDITICPYGNTTPSVTEPQFTMTAIVSEPNGALIGGDADASTTKKMTVDCEWDLLAKPTRQTT